MCIFKFSAFAQTSEEREKNTDSVHKLKAEQLKSKFQNNHTNSEKKVHDYLELEKLKFMSARRLKLKDFPTKASINWLSFVRNL